MNNKLKTTLLGGLLSASIASPALAGDFSAPIAGPVAASAPAAGGDIFSFSAGYHSTYVFRGIDFGDQLLDYSLEASGTVGGYDLTAGIWGANVLEVSAGSEIDFYASVGKDFGFAALEFGYIFYYFDGAESLNTQEIYLSASKEIFGFNFSATLFKDVDLTEAYYLEFGVDKTVAVGGLGDVDFSLVLGANPEDKEFTHLQPTVSKTFDLNSEVSITPYVSYSYSLEDLDGNGAVRDDEFIAGVSLGFSF